MSMFEKIRCRVLGHSFLLEKVHSKLIPQHHMSHLFKRRITFYEKKCSRCGEFKITKKIEIIVA